MSKALAKLLNILTRKKKRKRKKKKKGGFHKMNEYLYYPKGGLPAELLAAAH